MTELEPLLDGCDDFERALLRSTRGDTPPASSLPRTLGALGLGAGTLAVATGAGAASATPAAAFGAWTVLKMLGIGALAGTLVSAGSALLTREPPSPRPSAAPSTLALPAPASARTPATAALPTALEPAPDAPLAVTAAASTGAEPSASAANKAPAAPSASVRAAEPAAESAREPALPPSAAAVAAFAAAPSVPASEPPSAASIAEEVKTLDRARQALASGQAAQALAEASNYSARWPSGSLSLEAIVVRVEAELALGNRAAAERDARAVIAAHAGSRYASRVRALFTPPLSE